MFSKQNQMILKISKVNSINNEIIKYDNSLFKSTCLSAEDMKEDLINLGKDFKKELDELLKQNKDLSKFEKEINIIISQLEKI